MFVAVVGDWRDQHMFAWQQPDPERDEGPGLTWRQLTPRHWSGTWESKIRGTVTPDGDGWVAYLWLEDPPGPSPITVGPYATVEKAQVATDEVWAAREPKPIGISEGAGWGQGDLACSAM
jgi:hypothetical protein